MSQKNRKRSIYTSFFTSIIHFYYLSPVIIIMAAAEGIINGSFIIFGVLLITSIFFGRAFCGWICPSGGLQDMCMTVRKGRVKTGYFDLIKYIVVWIPWLYIIIAMAIKAGGYTKVDPLYFTWYGISVTDIHNFIVFLVVFGSIAIFSFIFGRRSFCHYACWMAPFMIIGTSIRNKLKLPGLRLRSDSSKCTDCMTCTKECLMSLDVNLMVKKEKMDNYECVLCGKCIDGCKEKAIKYTTK
jgi:ferredoxin-type protein NapH